MAEILFPLQFKRQYAAPLDVDVVFQTSAAMNTYLSNPLRYAGQIVSCLENEGKIFVLNNAQTIWTEIAGGTGTSGTVITPIRDYGMVYVNAIG
mgnify:CR=1 FL=1